MILTTPSSFDFSKCSDSAGVLTFANESESADSPITVHRIDRLLLDTGSLRAYISIDADAEVGKYDVSFQCNANTKMEGDFSVSELPDDIELSADPASLAAGTYGRRLTLSAQTSSEQTPFFSDETEFYFSQENMITVTNKNLLYEDEINKDSLCKQIELTVDVDPETPLGEMTISAVTDGYVAEGTVTVTDRVEATVSVSPDKVERQAVLQNTPPVYAITIEGDGIDFVAADDADTDEAEPTVVDFPENPGITVLEGLSIAEISGDDGVEKQLTAQIRVDSLASLGGTPLHVQTGGREAWTNFTVLLPDGTPMLKISSPHSIPRNGVETAVFVEAVNFTFEGMLSAGCEEAGCDVRNVTVDTSTYRTMTMEIAVDDTVTDSYITLAVEMPAYTVKEYLSVKAPDTAVLNLSPDTLSQGDTGKSVMLTLSDGGKFSSGTEVEVLSRSGVQIESAAVDVSLRYITLSVNVASDAPTGPAYLAATSGGVIYESPLEIEPMNESVPQMTLSPRVALKERNTTRVRVSGGGTGFELPAQTDGFAFDDPGLKVDDVYTDTDGGVVLLVNVSPTARTDTAVLYAKSDTGQAAASFRASAFQKTQILTPSPSVITRESGSPETTTVTALGDGIVFDMPVVDVSDNIGVEVTRVSGGQYLVFDLNVDTQDYAGWGGWVGLTVTDNSQNYLIPIYIEAGDSSILTAAMEPDTVYPGAEGLTVTATLPSAMSLDAGMLDVSTSHSGAYVSAPKLLSERSLTFFLDVSVDAVEIGGAQIPILVTTPAGAGCGYIAISEVETYSVDAGDTWNEALEEEDKTLFEVDDPGAYPSFFQAEYKRETDEAPQIFLVAENGLDTAEKSENGIMWMTNDSSRHLGVLSDRGAVSALVNVRARGISAQKEDTTADNKEWDIQTANPCNAPFLGQGTIQGALDEDIILLSHPECELTAFAASRDLADRPWDTPDLKIQYYDWYLNSKDEVILDNLIDFNVGASLFGDPAVTVAPSLIDEDRGVAVTLQAELGSAGDYLVQIRRPFVIREFSAIPGKSFVEIEIPADADLSLCELVLYNTQMEEAPEEERLTLFDAVTTGGILVIAGTLSDVDGADAYEDVASLPEEESFAVSLYYDSILVDAVQFEEGSVFRGEGNPIVAEDSRRTFFRIANIDTNDNASDFAPSFIKTPGR